MNAPLQVEPVIRISPTQIELWERCERHWHYDRVLNLRIYKPSKSQAIGITVENLIEAKIFRNEEPPRTKEGNIARAMLKHLPGYGTPGLVSQQELAFPVPIGSEGQTALVIGKKDLVLPGVTVWDFKTTKSLTKWQKTPAQLLADIQSQIYALDEWLKTNLDPIPLRWVYGQTEGAQKADVTAVDMPAEQAKKGWTRAVTAAERMLYLRQNKPPVEETKANIRACDMFGGCPHRAYCPARASKLSDFLPKEDRVSLKDKLKASLGIGEPSQGQKEALGEVKAAEVAKTDAAFRAAVGGGAAPGAVNPPDALPSPDDQPKAVEVAPAEEGKRKRRTKAEMEAAKAGAVAELTPKIDIHVEKPASSTPTSAVKTLLVIDGAALKGVGTPLEPLLRQAATVAAEKAEVPDWRLVDYGKGAGLLLVAFAELWARNPPTGILTVGSREPEAVAVLAWLIDRVDTVVKGV